MVTIAVLEIARDDMAVDVGHRLAGADSVLHGDVESVCLVDLLDKRVDQLNRVHEIDRFLPREHLQSMHPAIWNDEDVARNDRLQVHEGIGVFTSIEHLWVDWELVEEDLGRNMWRGHEWMA